jgi:hypothetical protein
MLGARVALGCGEVIMAYSKLAKAQWEVFFNAVFNALEGKLVTLKIVGPDVNVQIEGDQLSLTVMAYDRNDDVVYVEARYVETHSAAVSHVVHSVASPQEIYIEIGDDGVEQVLLLDGGGRQQFLRLRAA